jgi:hypothetical protein
MVDVQRREDRFLDELARLYARRTMTLVQLDLFEYGHPHLKPLFDDLRACLKGADE